MATTAGDVLTRTSALLNDVQQTMYTNIVLFPLLNIAWDELIEELNLNQIDFVIEEESVATVAAGALVYPVIEDMVYPISLMEKPEGAAITEYKPVLERPWVLKRLAVTELKEYQWRNNSIGFVGATSNRDVIVRYAKFPPAPATAGTPLSIPNSINFLALRTAQIASGAIGEDSPRFQALNKLANGALTRFVSIHVIKSGYKPIKQRPFRRKRRIH